MMQLRRACLLGLALWVLGHSPARAQQDEAAAHAKAVAEMLAATRLAEVTLAGLQRAGTLQLPNSELLRHMGAHVTQDEVMHRLVPVYVPLLTTDAARRIASGYRSADGQKVVALELAIARAGRFIAPAGKDRKAVNTFIMTPAAQAFQSAQKRAAPASASAMKRWLAQYQEALGKRATAEMYRYEDGIDIQSPIAPLPFVPTKTGISFMDDWSSLVAQTNARRTSAEWQFLADINAVGKQKLLAPENLAWREPLAAGVVMLGKIEVHTEQFLLELDTAMKEFIAGSEKVGSAKGRTMPEDLRERLAQEAALYARYADNHRARLRTMRAVLAFASARLGKLRVEGDSLVLDDKADLAAYNVLVAQLRRETAEGKELEAQAEQGRASRRQ